MATTRTRLPLPARDVPPVARILISTPMATKLLCSAIDPIERLVEHVLVPGAVPSLDIGFDLPEQVGARPLHASMPWYFFGKMSDDDLKSIFAFLQTLKPVKHQIDNTEPPTYCKLCKQKHGFGHTN